MTTAPEQDVRAPLSQEETLSRLGRYEYGWADSDIAGAGCPKLWCVTFRPRRTSRSGC